MGPARRASPHHHLTTQPYNSDSIFNCNNDLTLNNLTAMTSTPDTLSPQPAGLSEKIGTMGRDIKLSHTVFAMPWAILAMFLAGDTLPNGYPYIGQILLILLCMVTARTVAMLSNRLADAKFDANNPRTAGRALPSGKLSRTFVASAIALNALVFILATDGFYVFYNNGWPTMLSIPVLAFLASYPFLKRFTQLCHYYLGAALALAPICAYIAIAGTITLAPILIGGAVLFWTAGFDIIYACQDYAIDVKEGLYSVPAKLGIAHSLWVSRITHIVSVTFLIALAATTPQFGTLFWIGIIIASALLMAEHSLVKANDLSKVNLSFFTINGLISLLVGTLGIIDIFI